MSAARPNDSRLIPQCLPSPDPSLPVHSDNVDYLDFA